MLGNSAEDAREDQRVIDLVLEIASAASVDPCARALRIFRQDFRDGVGQGKDYAFLSHLRYPMSSKRLLLRNSNEDISASDHIRQQSDLIVLVGHLRDLPLSIVHVVGPAPVNRASRVTEYDILYSIRKKQLGNGDACGSGSVDQDLAISQVFLDYLGGIDETSKRNNGCSVLIIMEDRKYLEAVESLLDIEAFWGFDVFKVDSIEVAK